MDDRGGTGACRPVSHHRPGRRDALLAGQRVLRGALDGHRHLRVAQRAHPQPGEGRAVPDEGRHAGQVPAVRHQGRLSVAAGPANGLHAQPVGVDGGRVGAIAAGPVLVRAYRRVRALPRGHGQREGPGVQGRHPPRRGQRHAGRPRPPDRLRVHRRQVPLRQAVQPAGHRGRAAGLQQGPRPGRIRGAAAEPAGLRQPRLEQGPGGLSHLQGLAQHARADLRGHVLEVGGALVALGPADDGHAAGGQRRAVQPADQPRELVRRDAGRQAAAQAPVRAAGLHRRPVRRAGQGLPAHRDQPVPGQARGGRREARGGHGHGDIGAVRLPRLGPGARVQPGQGGPRPGRVPQARGPLLLPRAQVRQPAGRHQDGRRHHRPGGQPRQQDRLRPVLGRPHLQGARDRQHAAHQRRRRGRGPGQRGGRHAAGRRAERPDAGLSARAALQPARADAGWAAT